MSKRQGNCINSSKGFSLWCLMYPQLRIKCQLNARCSRCDSTRFFFVAVTFSSQRSLESLVHTHLPWPSAQEYAVELAFLGTEVLLRFSLGQGHRHMRMSGDFYLKNLFQNHLGSRYNLLNYKRKPYDCNFCRKWEGSSLHNHRGMLKGHISHLVLGAI